MRREFIDKIQRADLVLVGIGLEFEKSKYVCCTETYRCKMKKEKFNIER